MPRRENTRPRGAVATVLNQTLLADYVNEQNRALGYDGPPMLPLPGAQMLLNTKEGLAVLNYEGVGYMVTDTAGIILHTGTGGASFDIPLNVLEEAKTSETIDIADGIRFHNDRLDKNHHHWFNRYQPA